MSKTNFLCLVLAVILLIGIFSLPYDFDLSIGNNTSDKNAPSDEDITIEGEGEVRPNPGSPPDNTLDPFVSLRHPDSFICESCGKEYLITEKLQYIEDYGSIGKLYSLDVCDCGVYSSSPTILHEYSNKDGICTAAGCGYKCTHTFTWEAIEYYIHLDDRFSGFDIESPDDYGEVTAVFDGVCAICQKTIN